MQASRLECLLCGPFSLFQNGLVTTEGDNGWRNLVQPLVGPLMIAMIDKGFEIPRYKVVFQQDAILLDLEPMLDLALGLGMMRPTARLLHAFALQPFCQIACHVTGTIVAEQTSPASRSRNTLAKPAKPGSDPPLANRIFGRACTYL